jgi:hypothetical protein
MGEGRMRVNKTMPKETLAPGGGEGRKGQKNKMDTITW